jgi:hypothetical protein
MAHRWDNAFHNLDGKKTAMASSDHSQPRAGTHPQTLAAPALAADPIARAQHLVDSRPQGAYQVDWCQQAIHFGDLSVLAISSLRTQAATIPPRPNPRDFR